MNGTPRVSPVDVQPCEYTLKKVKTKLESARGRECVRAWLVLSENLTDLFSPVRTYDHSLHISLSLSRAVPTHTAAVPKNATATHTCHLCARFCRNPVRECVYVCTFYNSLAPGLFVKTLAAGEENMRMRSAIFPGSGPLLGRRE